MADCGIKISQPFFDATKSADQNLLFSSSWPTLPIAAEKTFTSNLFGGSDNFNDENLAFTHNLGFAPFHVCWYTNAVTGETARYVRGPTTFKNVGADTTRVYVQPSTSWSRIHAVCYNLNLSVDVEYPYNNITGTGGFYDNSFGIKIVKEGKDIKSADMRDFILHSRCQSPQILAVKTDQSAIDSSLGGGTREVVFTPPVSDPLWAFGFQKDPAGKYSFANYYNQSPPRLFVTANSNSTYTYRLNFWAAENYGATLVMLRDPMFAAKNVSVSY